jgi:YD repeat-containing protein
LRIDGKNRRTTYVYDDAGQQTSRQYQDTTRVTQGYDAVGRRTLIWDSTGRTATFYAV